MYEKLAGMTGTALTEASVSEDLQGGVVPIPTNMPMIRGDQRDLIYRTEEAKFEAIVEDVAERHEGPAGPHRHRIGRQIEILSGLETRRSQARGPQRQAARA